MNELEKRTSTLKCIPLKSTSPFPSSSKMSMTLWTSGFCWSSGSDINSSTLRLPEPSKSSFLKRRAKRRSSYASTGNPNNFWMLDVFSWSAPPVPWHFLQMWLLLSVSISITSKCVTRSLYFILYLYKSCCFVTLLQLHLNQKQLHSQYTDLIKPVYNQKQCLCI